MTPPPPLPQPKTSVAQAYVVFAIAVAFLIAVGTPLQLWSMPVGLAITEIVLILGLAVLYARLKRAPVAASLGWKPVAPALALRAVVIGASAWGIAILLYEATGAALTPLLGPDPTTGMLGQLVPDTWLGFGLTLLIAAVLPGICEESLFRGAIQGTLEKKGLRKAIVIAAVLFAVFHLDPWNLVPAFALGLVFGTLTARANSIVPAMIAHACCNAMAFGAAFFFQGRETSGAPWILVTLSGVFVLAFAEFLWRTRRAQHAPSPLAALPANVMPRTKHAVLWITVGAVVLLVAFVLTARCFLKSYRVETDVLAPEIQRGDMVLTLKARWLRNDEVRPGDVVAFTRGGEVLLRKVARLDATTIWVSDKCADGAPTEIAVPRSDLRGRMVHHVPLGKLKQ